MTPATLLLRQIHPHWIRDGRVTSQAFRPTRKDEDLLSVYDGDQIDAKSAYEHYTGQLALGSVGTMAVTVAECAQQELTAKADPIPFPEHVVIDFRPFPRSQVEAKAKYLARVAMERGWQYRV